MTDLPLPLQGKTAIMAGGACGIGHGIAVELTKAGVDLFGQSVNVDGGFTFH